MSIIQNIRDRGAWVIFGIIALALVAFILQDGFGKRGGGFFGNSNSVGKVNGKSISKEEFDENLKKYASMGGATINSQIWNMMVEEVIYNAEYDKLGLNVSGKEVREYLLGPNSPLARYPQFQGENGRLNEEAVMQLLTAYNKSKDTKQVQAINDEIIKPTVQTILRNKYQALLEHGSYVPNWLVEKTKADNAALSSISYVFVPYASITDSTIKVTDDEINSYVKKHPAGFEKEEESRVFSYVSFDANASKEDSATIYTTITNNKQEFATTTDIKTFLNRVGTEMPYLDGYVQKKALKMAYADSIKNLAEGRIFGPYIDGQNYVMAKMMGKRTLPDSVKVRHILVKTQENRQTVLPDSIAKKRIDSVEVLAKSAASNFDQLVQKYSDDEGSKKTKGEYDFTLQQFEGISKEFAEAIFYGKVGDKVVVKVENDKYAGYHYIEVINQKAVGEAIKVAYLAKQIMASNSTISNAKNAASQFAISVKNKKQFDEEAKKQNLMVQVSQEVKENDFTIPSFGSASVRQIVRWVYENDLGTVGNPEDVTNKFIVPIITSVNAKGLASATEARTRVEIFIKNEKKAKQIIEGKLKTATTLEAYAANAGVAVQKVDSLSFTNPTIAAVGYEPKIAGVAFNSNLKGKPSDPIAGNSGVLVVQVNKVYAKALETNDEAIKQTIIQAQRSASYSSGQALRKMANVKDNRFKHY